MKSTQLEWKEGPYSKEGVRCHDCHMPKGGPFLNALMTKPYDDSRLHLFHGAYDPGKVKGTIELRIQPDIREAEPDESNIFTVALFNQKTSHKFSTGSVEDRIVWLNVEATDAKGKVYHLNVDKKGFEGEEYTIKGDMSKWYLTGLLNWVESERYELDYRSATIHAGYLLRCNLRLVSEYTWKFSGNSYGKIDAGFIAAF